MEEATISEYARQLLRGAGRPRDQRGGSARRRLRTAKRQGGRDLAACRRGAEGNARAPR